MATYGLGMPMYSASPCITHPSMPPSSLRIRSNTEVSWNSPLAGQGQGGSGEQSLRLNPAWTNMVENPHLTLHDNSIPGNFPDSRPCTLMGLVPKVKYPGIIQPLCSKTGRSFIHTALDQGGAARGKASKAAECRRQGIHKAVQEGDAFVFFLLTL